MMEEEVDLGQYIEILIRHKKQIIAITLAVVIVVFIVSMFLPPVYEAEASLALLRVRSEVSFEPKFKTISAEGSLSRAGLESRQEAFTSLAQSHSIAATVFQALKDRWPDMVIGIRGLKNSVTVKAKGDLILIQARARDPQLAADIANAWANEAARLINTVYGQVSQPVAEVRSQAQQAKTRYENAQKALEKFISENRISSLQRRITELQEARDALQEAQLAVIGLHLGKQLEMVRGQADVYFNAWLTQTQAVFDQQQSDKLEMLSYYYERKRSLEKLLAQVQALREQLEGTNKSTPGDVGDALAVLQARAGVFGVTGQAGALNLHLEDIASLRDNPKLYVTDVEELIKRIQEQYDKTNQEIEKLSKELLEGQGYKYLSTAPQSSDPLFQAALGRLEAMMDLELPYKILPEYEARPLYETIEQLDSQIQKLQAELEAEQARQQELYSERDLAWETYQTLARKLAELEIAERVPDTEVRLATRALPPERPIAPQKVKNSIVAGIFGVIFGISLVSFNEYRRQWKAKQSRE